MKNPGSALTLFALALTTLVAAEQNAAWAAQPPKKLSCNDFVDPQTEVSSQAKSEALLWEARLNLRLWYPISAQPNALKQTQVSPGSARAEMAEYENMIHKVYEANKHKVGAAAGESYEQMKALEDKKYAELGVYLSAIGVEHLILKSQGRLSGYLILPRPNTSLGRLAQTWFNQQGSAVMFSRDNNGLLFARDSNILYVEQDMIFNGGQDVRLAPMLAKAAQSKIEELEWMAGDPIRLPEPVPGSLQFQVTMLPPGSPIKVAFRVPFRTDRVKSLPEPMAAQISRLVQLQLLNPTEHKLAVGVRTPEGEWFQSLPVGIPKHAKDYSFGDAFMQVKQHVQDVTTGDPRKHLPDLFFFVVGKDHLVPHDVELIKQFARAHNIGANSVSYVVVNPNREFGPVYYIHTRIAQANAMDSTAIVDQLREFYYPRESRLSAIEDLPKPGEEE